LLALGEENVQLGEGAIEQIMSASGGDMRKAVTYLQSSHQLSGGNIITADTVLDISGQVNYFFLFVGCF
jgi:replication factor C subunit 2/4